VGDGGVAVLVLVASVLAPITLGFLLPMSAVRIVRFVGWLRDT
jgi:hypothetical protein